MVICMGFFPLVFCKTKEKGHYCESDINQPDMHDMRYACRAEETTTNLNIADEERETAGAPHQQFHINNKTEPLQPAIEPILAKDSTTSSSLAEINRDPVPAAEPKQRLQNVFRTTCTTINSAVESLQHVHACVAQRDPVRREYRDDVGGIPIAEQLRAVRRYRHEGLHRCNMDDFGSTIAGWNDHRHMLRQAAIAAVSRSLPQDVRAYDEKRAHLRTVLTVLDNIMFGGASVGEDRYLIGVQYLRNRGLFVLPRCVDYV